MKRQTLDIGRRLRILLCAATAASLFVLPTSYAFARGGHGGGGHGSKGHGGGHAGAHVAKGHAGFARGGGHAGGGGVAASSRRGGAVEAKGRVLGVLSNAGAGAEVRGCEALVGGAQMGGPGSRAEKIPGRAEDVDFKPPLARQPAPERIQIAGRVW